MAKRDGDLGHSKPTQHTSRAISKMAVMWFVLEELFDDNLLQELFIFLFFIIIIFFYEITIPNYSIETSVFSDSVLA